MKFNFDWVVFDGDNTLWETEPLYDDARSKFVADLTSRLNSFGSNGAKPPLPKAIEEFQRNKDIELYELFGYASHRFGRSFEETVREYWPSESEGLTEAIRAAYKIAQEVFENKAHAFAGAGELLTVLKNDRNIKIGLLTAGELAVQRKRLDEFPFTNMFDWVRPTDKPKLIELKDLAKRFKVPRSKILVIGDSLRSDVGPALEARSSALWVAHANWSLEQRTKVGVFEKDKEELANYLIAHNLPASKAAIVEGIDDVLAFFELKSPKRKVSTVPRLLAYGVFEGGGAKGLAHAGAYKACQIHDVSFLGVAGTSAGSIAAGLIAAGYEPDELFEKDGTGALAVSYPEILGADEWGSGKKLLRDIDQARGPMWWRVCRVYFSNRSALNAIGENLGLLSTKPFRDWYNELLERKVKPSCKDRGVTFADIIRRNRSRVSALSKGLQGADELATYNGSYLKIVSTDLTNHRVCVHPDNSSRNLPVADAVAGSIALPGVFQPHEIQVNGKSTWHVDGGALSNFPAWIFQNRPRRMGGSVPIIGFRLEDTPVQEETRRPKDILKLAREISTTVVAGSSQLAMNNVEDLFVIPITTDVPVHAFDMGVDDQIRTHEYGLIQSTQAFSKSWYLVSQEQMEPFLADIYDEMLVKIGGDRFHLRVNIVAPRQVEDVAFKNRLKSEFPKTAHREFMPHGPLHVRYRYNADLDTDDWLQFEHIRGGGVGRCWETANTQVVDLEDTKRTYTEYKMSKYEQALVRPALRSLLCVPIFHPADKGQPRPKTRRLGILNFDSDERSALSVFKDRDVQSWAESKARILATAWAGLTQRDTSN